MIGCLRRQSKSIAVLQLQRNHRTDRFLRKRLYPLQASAAAAGASPFGGCPLPSLAATGASSRRRLLPPSPAAARALSLRGRPMPSLAATGELSLRGCPLLSFAATGASFCWAGEPHCAQNLAPSSNSLPQFVQNLLIRSMQLPFIPAIWLRALSLYAINGWQCRHPVV